MADTPTPPTLADKVENWSAVGEQVMAGALKTAIDSDLAKILATLVADVVGSVLAVAYTTLAPIGIGMAKGMADAEDLVAPAFAQAAANGVRDVFNVDVSASSFSSANGQGARTGAGTAIARGLIEQIRGSGTTIEPSDTQALTFIEAQATMAVEDWFKGWFFEVMSSLVPELDVGKIENYGRLGDKVAEVLGLGRISRRALGPLIDATMVTPLEWKTNLTYRHKLLAATTCARQIARGLGDANSWREDLRRQGYSEARIDALLNEQRKFFSPSDVRDLVYREHWDDQKGLQHLRDQGYDEATANDALRLEGVRRIAQLEQQEANAIIDAYVSGDIDHGTFTSALAAAVTPAPERNLLSELADVRKAMNVKRLTLSQVESMVKSGVLNVIDYRQAAEREGYESDAVTALELQLRSELDKAKSVEQHRQDLAAEKAAAAKLKADAAAAKAAIVEQQKALARRGKPADLERAGIRGLISLDRVQEIYDATYDADTVSILMDLLAGQRQDYLQQQQAREDAAKRAAVRGISVSELEAAVLAGVLTLDEYRLRLSQLEFAPADADLLVATLSAKVTDRQAAKDAHDQAAAAAKVKHVPLSTIETLVRRGHRTMADYDATLADLGFDDGARAAMEDLLQDTIDEDAKARALREAAAAKPVTKGLTLEQMRRAVLIGAATTDQFQTYLVDNRYTADAQIALLAELRADEDEAEAARQRRAEADAAKDSRDAPIADVARAARLGLISVQAYTDRLARAGYSDDAVALELDLLVQERTDTADAQRQQDAANQATAGKPLSLAQAAAAVKDGISSIATYVATAKANGYSDDAAATLGRLLADEVAADQASQARHDALAAAAAQPDPTLGQLEAGVVNGLLTFGDYVGILQDRGYAEDDVELLAGLLDIKLQKAASKGGS